MDFNFHIPAQTSYSFSEITSLSGVKPYVLRFWETEFEDISPTCDNSGRKIYSKADLDKISEIKNLLFNDKLSIDQAKESLKNISITKESVKKIDLKSALDAIIDNNSTSSVDDEKLLGETGENVVPTQSYVADNSRDIISLISAKKKLNSVLSKIDSMIQ